MLTTNIILATHLDGTRLKDADLKIGLQVYYPSGLGGVFKFECVSLDSDSAEFDCITPEWPRTLTMKFKQDDFILAEFERLSLALKAYEGFGSLPTDDDRAIAYKAQELGYARVNSYCQAHWTELGIEKYRELKQ